MTLTFVSVALSTNQDTIYNFDVTSRPYPSFCALSWQVLQTVLTFRPDLIL